MKKLPILAATFALALWGCANTSKVRSENNEPSVQEVADPVEQARESREDAPTVYDTEVSGDSGTHSTVTTPDGNKWDVMEEPHGDEPRTPVIQEDEATGGAGDVEADVEIIDEGPTEEEPRQ